MNRTKFDLYDLRAFLVVAEEQHLGRASERLSVSASPLSRQIRRLEENLSVELFDHARKRLRLTPAGEMFAHEARTLLAHAGEVEERSRHLASGVDGLLRVGYVPGAMLGGLLPGALRELRAGRPRLRLRLQAMRSQDQADALRRGAIDLGVLHTPPEQREGLDGLCLEKDRFALVVPEGHALAHGSPPSASMLASEPWITLAETVSRSFRARFLAACSRYGFEPVVAHEAPDVPSLLGLVEAGLGLGLLQSRIARLRPSGVSFVAMPDFPLAVPLHAYWRSDRLPAPAQALIRLLEALAGQAPPVGMYRQI